MHTYKIIEQNKENPYLSTIQKSGVKVEFNIVHLWDNIRALKRQLKEIEGKVGIEQATMKNIIQHYPDLIQMFMGQISMEDYAKAKGNDYKVTEKDRLAIDMFERSRRFCNGAEDKLIEFRLAIADDERSLKECCDALKITYPTEVEFTRAKDVKCERCGMTRGQFEEPGTDNYGTLCDLKVENGRHTFQNEADKETKPATT